MSHTMAANLPIELIHCVLEHVDLETYVAARSSCRPWRSAASISSILRRALKEAPLSIPPRVELLTNEEWNVYFYQITHLNLLGHRTQVEKSELRRVLPDDCSPTSVLASSHDGQTLVTLKGTRATMYSHPDKRSPWEFSLASSLYPLWTSVCRAMMEGGSSGSMVLDQRYAKHRIAISSQGHLLAVALGTTIQIYNLGDEDGIASPAEYVLGENSGIFSSPPIAGYEETNGVVESLEFSNDDTLLRVVIGKETTTFQPSRVRYLGNPCNTPQHHPNIQYWRDNLNHIFLDSVSMAVSLGAGEGKVILRGLRLLSPSYYDPKLQDLPVDPSSTSHYFTALLHSEHTNSYCIGLVTTSPSSPQTITITRLLPSRQHHSIPTHESSSPSTPANPVTISKDPQSISASLQSASHRWNPTNLPAASTTNPLLALSDDANLLVVYEPAAGPCCFVDGGALYVYCIKNCIPVYTSQPSAETNNITNNNPPLDLQSLTSSKGKYPPLDVIPSWSFLLDVSNVDVDDLQITRADDGGSGYVVSAAAGKDIIEWRIR
ncbi:hypothetical protein BO70DRAFT_127665 [Aspergillus heteromorphus CBS 117.55]|uniref:F-box domain-containing protein n=1 Tax=Aspergillus heteromorphus CBS 117.55 TaxID=1448321 RepID=A0A317WTM8_9EURO|nr:uncharacterized protein BO70DRAFT_127665 [Aspergillus heteromorphus CBS 117.55]PWY89754.1 hypothetical protein BO70DRAFT_127665 [Aspergillus heteromorphus CBS 117.55]